MILSLNASIVGAFGPMISPAFVQIAKELNVSVTALSQTTSWLVLSMGLSLFFVSPIAKIYGRRPMFVFASLIMMATSIWGALASNYASLLGARVVAAIGMAPYETLVQCVIGDIYFVHERATRIAVWNLLLVGGINAGSTVAGYITEASGYRWTFGACAVCFGVLTVCVILLVPETMYCREVLAPVVTLDEKGQKKLHMRPRHHINLQGEEFEGRYIEISAAESKHTFWDRMRIFNGRFSSSPYWRVFSRSIVMLFYPAVMWAFLTYGTFKVNLLSVIIDTVFVANTSFSA